MKSNKECPFCGRKDIKEGELSGYANIILINNFSLLEPVIIAEICTKCGQIISLKQKSRKI